MKDPAFLFYTNDFQSGTVDMSCEEVGAYLRLLMYQHQHGKIPVNKERLMRITGVFSEESFDSIWDIVGEKFNQNGNHLVNQRLSKEVTKRAEYKPKKIASATLAGLISKSSNLSSKQVIEIKKSFNINDFIDFNNDEIKEKVRGWFNQMVDQMVNNLENENENENENEIINGIKGGVGENIETLAEMADKIAANEAKLDNRLSIFREQCAEYVPIYGKEMIRAFFNYWTEPNKTKTKMRFELERTWDLKRRLTTWSNNETKFKKDERNNNSQRTQSGVSDDYKRSILERLHASGSTG